MCSSDLERVSMPDIDVDFCEERRGEVLDYVRQKYGKECVGQIITFGTLKSRAAIKDVGRVLGFTPAETDAIAKLVPNQPNFSLTVAEAIEKVPELHKLYEQDDRHQQLLDFAIALEGLSRHAGVHAAGAGGLVRLTAEACRARIAHWLEKRKSALASAEKPGCFSSPPCYAAEFPGYFGETAD